MTYQELVEKVRKIYEKMDASSVTEHLAIQFNIFGEGEGAFYVELADGHVNVEPYEYFDRDILISTTYDFALEIVSGYKNIQEEAYAGRLFAEGRLGKCQLLDLLTEKKATKTRKTTKAAKTEKAEKPEKAEKKAKKADKEVKAEKKPGASKKKILKAENVSGAVKETAEKTIEAADKAVKLAVKAAGTATEKLSELAEKLQESKDDASSDKKE